MQLYVKIKKKLAGFVLEVEFEAAEGVFALLGSSGCGKSMTLKCIAGIERPDEGRIELGGRVLFDSDRRINLPPQKRHAGYLFQDYALFPNMTVLENVQAGLAGAVSQRTKKRMEKREMALEAGRILSRFHIDDLADRFPDRLSGGQKQRAAMARLIAQDPEIILLDEPFSALDSSLRWQLEQEMRSTLRSMKKPAIFVTHNRDEVFHMADTVCCIEAGKSGRVTSVRSFFEDPGTREAAILSGCKNLSAVEILGPSRLRAVDWGVELYLRKEIPPDTRYIGIRAHAFTAAKEEGSDNSLPLLGAEVLEDLFEWTISFRASPGGGTLQWKTAKTEAAGPSLPERLYLDSGKIMLLEGEQR